MKTFELQVTYRRGRPVAAYLYLPRRAGDKAKSTKEPVPGLLVDYAADGRPLGIEIRSPGHVSTDQINQVLAQIGFEPLRDEELAPLRAA